MIFTNWKTYCKPTVNPKWQFFFIIFYLWCPLKQPAIPRGTLPSQAPLKVWAHAARRWQCFQAPNSGWYFSTTSWSIPEVGISHDWWTFIVEGFSITRVFNNQGFYQTSIYNGFSIAKVKLTVCYWKWQFIVDCPLNIVIFHSFLLTFTRG